MSAIRSRVAVKVREWEALAQTLADCRCLEFDCEIPALRTLRAVTPEGQDPDAFLGTLRAHPNVERASFDVVVKLGAIDTHAARRPSDNDDIWAAIWHHAQMDTYRAWEETVGDSGVVVAIIDTGIVEHEDLPTVPPERQYNAFTATYGDASDWQWYYVAADGITWRPFGHGTMAAGIIFAQHNDKGVRGIAPSCTPLIVDGYDEGAAAREAYEPLAITLGCAGIVEAADYAVRTGSRVIISASWGLVDMGESGDDVALISDAVEYARRRGAVVVAAAGNNFHDIGGESGFTEYDYPAQSTGAICVGALHGSGIRVPYSNYGSPVDAVAPTNIGTCYVPTAAVTLEHNTHEVWEGKYWSGTGTSSATPTVAGVLALAWSKNPGLVPDCPAWAPWATRVVGEFCSNAGKAYRSTQGGASSNVAPTGTGASITDGAARWAYVGANDEIGAVLRAGLMPFINPATAANFPNAGVTNAARVVLAAKSRLAANAGRVFPYVGFFCEGYTYGLGDIQARFFNDTSPQLVVGPPTTVRYTSDGNAITARLDGAVWMDLRGYSRKPDGSDDPITRVVLKVGSTTVYDGAPGLIQANTATWPLAHVVALTAYTASGASGTEVSTRFVTNGTVAAGSEYLTAEAGAVSAGTVTVCGSRVAGTTVTLSAPGATPGAVAYPDATNWTALISGIGPDVTTVTATASDFSSASVTVEGGALGDPAPFAAAFALTQNAVYQVANLAPATFPVTFAAQLGAVYDGPLGGSVIYDARLGAGLDAGYADETAQAFAATLGATADAEAMPALAPSWLARVVRSGLSWLAGPFQPFTLNPATALDALVTFGSSADARVDYATYDGFAVRVGQVFDAAFGPDFHDGAVFPWTASAAFDAAYSDAPPREADTDIYAQCIPVGLVARPVSSDIFADRHPAGLRASNGT